MQKKVLSIKQCAISAACAGLCLIFLTPFAACAQTDTAKKLKEVNIKTQALPQIQTITPAQQISAADFDRYSAFNVADAIRGFAGVNIKDYGGIGGLKTVSVRSLGANHLAVFYDGVQINDAQNGQIDLGRLNLDNVQSIALYNAQPPQLCLPARAFASASVLAIITVQPKLTEAKPYQVLLGLKGGSFGLINPYLQWQQRLNNKWSLVVNSYLESANGRYRYKVNGDGSDTSATRTNGGVNAQEADAALYQTVNDSNKFNLHINYFNSSRGLPGAVIFYNPTSNQHLWNRDVFMQSGYEHTWQTGWHLLLGGKLSQDYTRYTDPDFLNSTGGLDERYTQRELYLSAAVAYHLTENWEASYATDFSVTDFDANLYSFAYPTRVTVLNALSSKINLGRWQFQGNLLHTYVDESVKTGHATPSRNVFSPTLMASWQPLSNSGLQLRAFYKDIFRNPTFDEQYYFSVNGSRNIKPEFAKQYDLGLSYRKALNGWLDYVALTVDGYYNTITDKIIALPNQNPAILSILNLGKVQIEGADVGLKTQTKLSQNGWRGLLSVNYTYQDAIDITDPTSSFYHQQIPYTPKSSLAVNAGADYRQMGLYYNQVLSSSRYYLSNNIPENLVGGYAVSDLSFVYHFTAGGKPMLFSAHADNLFNQNYVIVRSFPMPGRSYLISIQIKI